MFSWLVTMTSCRVFERCRRSASSGLPHRGVTRLRERRSRAEAVTRHVEVLCPDTGVLVTHPTTVLKPHNAMQSDRAQNCWYNSSVMDIIVLLFLSLFLPESTYYNLLVEYPQVGRLGWLGPPLSSDVTSVSSAFCCANHRRQQRIQHRHLWNCSRS